MDFDGVGVLKGKEVSKPSSDVFGKVEMINHEDRETLGGRTIKGREVASNHICFLFMVDFYICLLFMTIHGNLLYFNFLLFF